MKRNEVIVYEHKKGVKARKYNTKYVDPTKKSDTLIEPAKPSKKKDVDEGRFGRSNYYNPMDYERDQQRQMDYDRREFKRQELQHELGHEDDPDFERNLRQQQMDRDRGPWYLKINGKILKVKGEPKVFDWKSGASKYGQAILKNKPELNGKIFLTKRGEDDQTANEEMEGEMGTISAATPDGKVKIKTSGGQEIETTKDQLMPGEGGTVQMKPTDQNAIKPGTKVTTPATEDMMASPTDSQSPIPGDNDHDEISKLLVLKLRKLAGLERSLSETGADKDLGNGFTLTTTEFNGKMVPAVFDLEGNRHWIKNDSGDRKYGAAQFITIQNGKAVGSNPGPMTAAALKQAGMQTAAPAAPASLAWNQMTPDQQAAFKAKQQADDAAAAQGGQNIQNYLANKRRTPTTPSNEELNTVLKIAGLR